MEHPLVSSRACTRSIFFQKVGGVFGCRIAEARSVGRADEAWFERVLPRPTKGRAFGSHQIVAQMSAVRAAEMDRRLTMRSSCRSATVLREPAVAISPRSFTRVVGRRRHAT